jgi:hypothetical protein
MTSTARPALTYDQILDEGCTTEDVVLLCLKGSLTRKYEAVAARIAARTAEEMDAREAAKIRARAAANVAALRAEQAGADDRLSSKPAPLPVDDPGNDEPYVDPEQGEADRLIAEMKRYTVPFVLRAVPDERWTELIGLHPPRRDPADAKKIDPRDSNVNSETFYRSLVRESVVDPEHDDARWARLTRLLTAAQMGRLIATATDINQRDEDLPFSPADLETPPH